MNNEYKDLAFEIIIKAIDDYRFLKELGVSKFDFLDEGVISKKEIEDFFRSNWCNFLLSTMDLTGEDILRYLNRE